MTEGESIASSRRAALTHPAQLATSQRQKEVSAKRSCQRAKGTSMMCQHTGLKQRRRISRGSHTIFVNRLTECGQLNSYGREAPEEAFQLCLLRAAEEAAKGP